MLGSLLWIRLAKEFFPSLGMSFVYFTIEFTSLDEHATPHEYVGLLKLGDLIS